ncbi:MAG: transcriptional regulator, AraC family, partial [Actinomycetia bacterium]|nr:transcriptional regulator, AraC family [Actinomycetes bacterium]
QRVLTYPAHNAVIMPERADLYGPDPRVQVQELRGVSWAVGILFRPAAGPLLTTTDPVALAGASEPLPTAPAGPVRQLMAGAGYARDELARTLRAWLLPVAASVDDRGRLVNEACRLAEGLRADVGGPQAVVVEPGGAFEAATASGPAVPGRGRALCGWRTWSGPR